MGKEMGRERTVHPHRQSETDCHFCQLSQSTFGIAGSDAHDDRIPPYFVLVVCVWGDLFLHSIFVHAKAKARRREGHLLGIDIGIPEEEKEEDDDSDAL